MAQKTVLTSDDFLKLAAALGLGADSAALLYTFYTDLLAVQTTVDTLETTVADHETRITALE